MARPSYRARRASERSERIARARHNLRVRRCPGSDAAMLPALQHGDRVVAAFGLAFGVALLGHFGVAYAASCSTPPIDLDAPRAVQVRVLPTPPRPTSSEPAPSPVPVAVRAPRPVRPRAKPAAREVSVPAPAIPQTPEPVTIVGLSLESTSSGGSGAAFSIGQTLTGETERVAHEVQADAPPPAPLPAAQGPRPSRNQRATLRPAAGVQVEPARRLVRVQPEYPALLERQRIEADVTVRVQIGSDGRLLKVELVRGAAQQAFDDAALAAARKERFSPETHDGVPVATSLIYTYRFRITP